ncbi:protein NUCLEAR FUSION DEFECTIVE 4 [Canna indica]|uniref:Protein NUCLEAR FUSION DEFECTIVE 4 n=1 Tax=Canna indica TaxID=4628 RepID=A0AAQ3JLV1_9LILI|nr:protein NUCLEAR FUSION DEFECTIVE 4 [Canna indica]
MLSWLVFQETVRSFGVPRIGTAKSRSIGKHPPLGNEEEYSGGKSRGRQVMAGDQSRKWMVVAAAVWIQAFTGTNFDFSAYSSDLKAAMGISQVQLNYLATASDLGKALGWSSGLALLYFPLPAVLFLAASIGLAAYGAQWLLITNRISLSYFPVFLLCLLAGCSICWFNTVCFVLCIRNFPVNRSLALSLTISFNGLSASLYTLAANAVGGSSSTYLLLNGVLPFLASTAALLPILLQSSTNLFLSARFDADHNDSCVFLLLNILAFIIGLYLLFLNSISSIPSNARMLLGGAILLLLLPLCVPGVLCARDWARRTIYSSSLFKLIGVEDLDLQKQLVQSSEDSSTHITIGDPDINSDDDYNDGTNGEVAGQSSSYSWFSWWCMYCDGITKDRLRALGEEHTATRLVCRIDFWLYYAAYFCGATVGLVYSNNLGQIAQSLGRQSQTTTLITVYSSCSFFGRLISATPDFLRGKFNFARTGWLAIAVVPMPLAFFLLAEAVDMHALLAGTALIGLSSGFFFSAAVCVSSELFGTNSLGVNHNILITNIPLGSLLYGLLAALIYDANGKSMGPMIILRDGMVVCMGRKCYAKTFFWWACITLIGLASSLALYLRTKLIYVRVAPPQQPREQIFQSNRG